MKNGGFLCFLSQIRFQIISCWPYPYLLGGTYFTLRYLPWQKVPPVHMTIGQKEMVLERSWLIKILKLLVILFFLFGGAWCLELNLPDAMTWISLLYKFSVILVAIYFLSPSSKS